MLIDANILQPLITVFQDVITFFHNHVIASWGASIILLTVAIRVVLLPLTIKQFHSMQKMQRLAPEIKRVQAKYKQDKQRQQQELMKFYQENKINPFASCLPLVLQLPVFISLFYMLRTDLKKHICGPQLLAKYNMHHTAVASVAHLPSKFLERTSCEQVAPHSAKFLFIPDITNHATGVVLIVLLVLYVASQLGSSLLMSAAVDKNQRRMMMLLPVVFVAFIFKFPAGLLVYWITTNLWTVAQQYLIRRRVGPPPATGHAPAAKAGRNGAGALEPAMAAAVPSSPPPPPPRKKKKRSGRRR